MEFIREIPETDALNPTHRQKNLRIRARLITDEALAYILYEGVSR